MKKMLLLLSLIALMTGCKDRCEDCPNTADRPNTTVGAAMTAYDCSNIARYPGDNNDGAAWLRSCGDGINKADLYTAVHDTHLVVGTPIPTTGTVPVKITLQQIQQLTEGISRYGCYIGFTTSGNNVTGIKRVPVYTYTPGNRAAALYSIPLFLSIAEKYNVSEFECYFGKPAAGGNETVMIKIQSGAANVNFDFSDRPKKLGAGGSSPL